MATAIDVEPRLHQDNEQARTAEGWVKMHEGVFGPTFRLRCRLRLGDEALERFTSVASTVGLTLVLDGDGWVRIRHKLAGVLAS